MLKRNYKGFTELGFTSLCTSLPLKNVQKTKLRMQQPTALKLN